MVTNVATKSLTELLNRQVANWNLLYVKIHNYHWFITGPNFFTLHEKFEQLYNEADKYIDELAERILMMNGKPQATMREYLASASVKEASGNESEEEMVKTIIEDFGTLISESKEAIQVAEAENDDVTSDMLISICQSLEKHMWMLRSFIQG